MSTIYRRGGKKNKSGTYYIQYFDESGKRRTAKGCKDKSATEALARKLETDVMLRKTGIIDPKMDHYAEEGRKPIQQHLDDWKESLDSRGITAKHVKLVIFRTTRVLKLAGIETLKDVTSFVIEKAISELRENGLSAKTLNDTLASVKQLCKWLRANGRVSENPIDHLRGFNTAVDRRHDRRALSDDEIKRLLIASEKGRKLQGCTGSERALIYRLALLSGLRANEIGTLKKGSFSLDVDLPVVTVEAAFSKHRKKDVQPLPDEIIPLLEDFLSTKENGEFVFHMPKKPVNAIREDLENAGIEYHTLQGYADFHSLRHTFITRIVKSGVNPKTAQILARHHDASLTLNVYSHIELIDQSAALKSLPKLDGDDTNPNREFNQATGTYGGGSDAVDANKVSALVGTSVGSQVTLSGKTCHSTSQKNLKQNNGNTNKVSTLCSVSHDVSSNVKSEKKPKEAGDCPASCSNFKTL